MSSADLSGVERPGRWNKLQDILFVVGFASASAIAMFGWLAALGWVAVQTTDWMFNIS